MLYTADRLYPRAAPSEPRRRFRAGLEDADRPSYVEAALMAMITHDLTTTGTKSCTVICRELVKADVDPDTPIEFVRGTAPVFASRPVRWWAERRVREADSNGPMRFEMYRTGSDPE